jgi:signal transduction histidine kinase
VEWVIAREVRAKADPNLVNIVLENLLANAWKFTRKLGHARIEVGEARLGTERECV